MAEDEAFADYVQRLRAGEEKAATDLVQRYEPIIRREIRMRLSNPSVYRVLDDQDVCQSVLASFFVRASLGQYDLTDVAQLKQLLLGMARNKLAHAARRQLTRKRGGGTAAASTDDLSVAGAGPTASRVVAGRELLERVRSHLSDDERRVAELRGLGHSWVEIAEQLGGSADGRRMQLTRGLERVSRELGLEDGDD